MSRPFVMQLNAVLRRDRLRTLAILFAAWTLPLSSALAQPKLSKPLQLPPGLEETLPIAKSGSYFGEAVKIQDCPNDQDNPLGLCNNLLFGGLAMFVSQLSGNIHIQFSTPLDNVAQFQITHPGGLQGEPVVERAPISYQFPVTGARFTDELLLTRGELDLTTGEVKNLDYRLCVQSNILDAYKNLNPSLTGCEVWFPGVYGTALGRFEQREDGLLDFTFFGSTFAPLSNNQNGQGDDKVRIPLPVCATPGVCAGIEAPGTTLRPRVRLSTRDPGGAACGADCPDLPLNSVQTFTASAYYSSMGDRFDYLNIAELGGSSTGWSHLSGRLSIQFGDRYGDLVPVAVWAMPPEGVLAERPAGDYPGFGINMLGVDGRVKFPNFTYVAVDRVLINDPFDFAVGVFNVKTGQSLGDFVYRGLPYQTLFTVIQQLNAGRIPTDTFRYQGPASFERGPNGALIFRYNAELFLDFSTFLWPTPDYDPVRGFRAPQGSRLDPFLKFQATAGGAASVALKSGTISEVSSFGDPVTIRYSVSCDPANRSFSLEYANGANATRGGTFRMEALGAVNCSNARGSAASPGDADMITFSGFGSWSKDSDQHLASVQISTAPDTKYFIVQIDGGLLSSADTILTRETDP